MPILQAHRPFRLGLSVYYEVKHGCPRVAERSACRASLRHGQNSRRSAGLCDPVGCSEPGDAPDRNRRAEDEGPERTRRVFATASDFRLTRSKLLFSAYQPPRLKLFASGVARLDCREDGESRHGEGVPPSLRRADWECPDTVWPATNRLSGVRPTYDPIWGNSDNGRRWS